MREILVKDYFMKIQFLLHSALLSIFAATVAGGDLYADEPVSLNEIAHVHGIAVNPLQTDQLYLATHKGLFLGTSTGGASQVSEISDDLMGFAPHPNDPSVFFASGHPSPGGNLGVLKSVDGGKTWNKLSDGASGPVDFHAMAISPADPNVMFGANKDLQVSSDGGKNWEIVGEVPGEVFDIAASAQDSYTLFAATRKGLYRSPDRGKSWEAAYMVLKPTTMIDVAADGKIHAFIYEIGLVSAEEKDLDWKNISNSFQDRFFWRLESDPKNSNRLFAIADTGALMMSKDGGKAWTSYENHEWADNNVIEKGRVLFEENCQDCHGERGVGEKPDDMYAKDDFGFVAPPLNDSAHGWHHSDQGIVETILNGSSRNERMIAWKDILTRGDAENLVAYIKSLWSFRSTACQGSRHMSCMN